MEKPFHTCHRFNRLVGGGYLVVYYGKEIALSLGMSETLVVGLTIVALDASLPEQLTSITAALKKESEIALDYIIGSNTFNIMFISGTSATIKFFNLDTKSNFRYRIDDFTNLHCFDFFLHASKKNQSRRRLNTSACIHKLT